MANAFNIKPFGLNVIPDRTAKQAAETVENAIGNLWSPVLDYLEKNNDIFNGNIATEIEKLNIQTMRLGMTMNEENTVRSLDTQF